MATLLVTPRMNPALRARVERAVSHRARARHRAAAVGLSQTLAGRVPLGRARLLSLLAAGLVVLLGFATYKHDRRTVEAERRALLAALDERRAGLSAGQDAFLATSERWIASAASEADAADVIDPSLRMPGALDAWLRRPAVYVRGLSTELGDARKLDDAARGSIKDAFLLCLLSPPASSAERDLLAKVRGVYFGGAKVDDATANVRPLVEARLGLGVFGPSFESAARAAEDLPALKKLRRELEASPIEQAKKAAGAELLIVVADDAAPPNAPARGARVTLVDLASKRVQLRLRRPIEEQGSSATAALYREQLEGCSLALAVRRSVGE